MMLRDWGLPERLELERCGELSRKRRYTTLLREVQELYDVAKSLQKGWPDERAHEEDLEGHIALAQKLARASRAIWPGSGALHGAQRSILSRSWKSPASWNASTESRCAGGHDPRGG
jgi:hypothetical protein